MSLILITSSLGILTASYGYWRAFKSKSIPVFALATVVLMATGIGFALTMAIKEESARPDPIESPGEQ
jgi:hypothetical protein